MRGEEVAKELFGEKSEDDEAVVYLEFANER
jgi:hypothetical protein